MLGHEAAGEFIWIASDRFFDDLREAHCIGGGERHGCDPFRRPALGPVEGRARDVDPQEGDLVEAERLRRLDDIGQVAVVLLLDDRSRGDAKTRSQQSECTHPRGEAVVGVGDVADTIMNLATAVERDRDLIAPAHDLRRPPLEQEPG